jgi:Flp pilus assembly protein CpaB
MKKSLIVMIAAVILAGCSSGLTIGNVGIPGGAKNAETREMGKNTQLVYMTDGDMKVACDAQSNLMTGWLSDAEPDVNDTYMSRTFTSGDATMTVMCSEQREGEKLMGTKVTMTLQGWVK